MRPITAGAAEGLGSLFGTPAAGASNVGQGIIADTAAQSASGIGGGVMSSGAIPAINSSARLLHLLLLRSRTTLALGTPEMFKASGTSMIAPNVIPNVRPPVPSTILGGLIDTSRHIDPSGLITQSQSCIYSCGWSWFTNGSNSSTSTGTTYNATTRRKRF